MSNTLPKEKQKEISYLGYIFRFSITTFIFMGVFIMLTKMLVSGLENFGMYAYSSKSLKSEITQELLDKKIIDSTDDLLYLLSSKNIDLTENSAAIVKDGIVFFDIKMSKESQKTKIYFKNIDELEIKIKTPLNGYDRVTLSIFEDENDQRLLSCSLEKNISVKDFKDELLSLLGAEKTFLLSNDSSVKLLKNKPKVDKYISLIKQNISEHKSNTYIADMITAGYRYYIDNKDEFSTYNRAILKLLDADSKETTDSEIWIASLSKPTLEEDSFYKFFKQLNRLDSPIEDTNTVWGIVKGRLPNIYLYFLDKNLGKILNSDINTSLILLYKKDGTTIEDMNQSRKYIVSETYRSMSDFCDEAENISCSAVEYVTKATESSSLNPSAYFEHAYLIDNNAKGIKYLENVLALTKVSQGLLDYDMYAVYNNLGYAIYVDSQREKYDDALKYLEKAYMLNNDSVYSLATMAAIYRELEEYNLEYQVLKDEAYKFLHASDETLLDKGTNYWIFVKRLAKTSYYFKDYNTTEYVCNTYLRLKDVEDEDCNEYLKEIKELPKSSSIKPMYTFWTLYTEPEMYTPKKYEEETKTAQCGTVSSYKESLKFRSTTQIQSHLLEKFTQIYKPFKVPNTLKELIKIEEKLGADNYVVSFYLDPEDRSDFFRYTFSYEDEKLNNKVAEHFLPLAHIDGTGATAGFWLKDANNTDLENTPIVEFGSEGHIGLIAKNIKDFIYMLSFGDEPMDGIYSQYVSEDEEYYRRPGFMEYREWLKNTMKIEPVEDWKVFGAPEKIEALQNEAQRLYKKKFFDFLYEQLPIRYADEKKEEDVFEALSKEKQRLLHLIEKKDKDTSYYRVAKNEEKLQNINRASNKDVEKYYKKAYEADEKNTTIVDQWARFVGNFEDKEKIDTPKLKAHYNISLQKVYKELGLKEKEKEYKNRAIDFYKQAITQEKKLIKQMEIYKKIARIYEDSKDLNNTILYLEKAIQLDIAEDKLWKKKYIYKDLSELYTQQQHYKKAIYYLEKMVSLIDEEHKKARYYYEIALNYQSLKEAKMALEYARKAFVSSLLESSLHKKSKQLIDEVKLSL